jgi:hypothetical protein
MFFGREKLDVSRLSIGTVGGFSKFDPDPDSDPDFQKRNISKRRYGALILPARDPWREKG